MCTENFNKLLITFIKSVSWVLSRYSQFTEENITQFDTVGLSDGV